MKKLIALALCACWLLGPAAQARETTLSELKQQTPDRLQMEVATDAGETVLVDAPILLPEGETLPLVLTQYAIFNTLDLYTVYPPRAFYGPSDYLVRERCPTLRIDQEEKEDTIHGKTDYTGRYALSEGEMPPGNETTPEEILTFLQENVQRFQCDAPLDIRVEKAVAMSGLCKMKSEKVGDDDVSWTEIVADPEQPLKSGTKGIWEIRFAQYMYGAKILEDYHPLGSYQSPMNPTYWLNPIGIYSFWLDAQNRTLNLSALKEVELLDEDVRLLSYEEVLARLEDRIREGKLKSIYGLRLGYGVRLVKGDAYVDQNEDISLDTRFVLVPEWQILGFDEKDAPAAKAYLGGAQPSREAILDPARYSRYGLHYELRMDAVTGDFILDYEAQEFDLEE